MKGALVVAMLAVGLVGVSAYCPNLCSGHGSCLDEDRCDCYTQKGTEAGLLGNGDSSVRKAWTGPDCSLRMCPVAPAFSGATPTGLSAEFTIASTPVAYQVTLTHSSNANGALTAFVATIQRGSEIIVTKTGAPPTILTVYSVTGGAGTDLVINTYNKVPADVIANHANYKVSVQTYSAPANTLSDPDMAYGMHAKLECSGQGSCNRETGTCECFAGYEGEACTRTSCPADCSGHGVCMSLRRLAKDANEERETAMDSVAGHVTALIYNGWDADKEFGCKCDNGFRGPACDQIECPSQTDPMWGCGGGTCNLKNQNADILDVTTPVVKAGATAADPDFITYSRCPTDMQCANNEQRDCSGRGLCDYTSGVCTCFSGFYGEACEIQTILV